MAKYQNDLVLDAALAYISANATEYYLCTAQPTDRATAISTAVVASMAPTFTGPANGDTSGRKVTIDAESAVAVTASGTATHLALCSGTTLIYVTTVTSQGVSSGGTVNVPAWDIEFADVTP